MDALPDLKNTCSDFCSHWAFILPSFCNSGGFGGFCPIFSGRLVLYAYIFGPLKGSTPCLKYF